MHRRNGQVFQPKAFQNFQAAFARSQLLSLRVVRYNVACVQIRSIGKLSDVMTKVGAGCFVVVDNSNFSTDNLREPNSSGIPNAEIPSCVDLADWIIWRRANSFILLGLLHEL